MQTTGTRRSGINPIRVKNVAMLSKWNFRWNSERQKSWNVWMRGKYGISAHESMTSTQHLNKLSESMKAIKKASEFPGLREKLSQDNFAWKLKNGKTILFWEDRWSGKSSIKDTHPKLYKLSTLKEISVSEVFECWKGNDISTSCQFWSRPLRPWEMEEASKIGDLVRTITLAKDKDEMIWAYTKKGLSLKAATDLLTCNSSPISWEFVWKLKVPNKVKIFLWKAHLGILPTRNFLALRNIKLSDSTTCPVCKLEGETTGHLLIECKMAKAVWTQMFSWWQINPVPPHEMSLMSIWQQSKQFSTRKARITWKVCVSAALWCIWLVRNQVVFRNMEVKMQSAISYFKQLAKEWCLANNLILQNAATWWSVNPMGVLTSSERAQLSNIMQVEEDLIGFTDGSCKTRGEFKFAGIGGNILNKKGNVIFSFSGPSSATTSFEAESQALEFLVKSFSNSDYKASNMVIYSDCLKLVHKVLEVTTAHCTDEKQDLREIFKGLKIRCAFIPSELNSEADFLAKKGAKSKHLTSCWITNCSGPFSQPKP